MKEIKPCPFCKGEGNICENHNHHYFEGAVAIYVECSDCYSSGPIFVYPDRFDTLESEIDKAKQRAIEKWNQRS